MVPHISIRFYVNMSFWLYNIYIIFQDDEYKEYSYEICNQTPDSQDSNWNHNIPGPKLTTAVLVVDVLVIILVAKFGWIKSLVALL